MVDCILQSSDRLKEPVESCDVVQDIQSVISLKGTGQPVPEQLLPDFYAEHMTLAMNRERRKQVSPNFLIPTPAYAQHLKSTFLIPDPDNF